MMVSSTVVTNVTLKQHRRGIYWTTHIQDMRVEVWYGRGYGMRVEDFAVINVTIKQLLWWP